MQPIMQSANTVLSDTVRFDITSYSTVGLGVTDIAVYSEVNEWYNGVNTFHAVLGFLSFC